MRILVADDEPVGREIVARILSARTRHEIVTVEDGARALELALAEPRFDVLLLDWMMPGLAGPEVCRRVRAAPLTVQPYVALVTGKNMRAEVIEGLSAGADDFLPKPVAPDFLLARLAVVARRPTVRRAAGAPIETALRSAAAQGDGELVVKSGELSARVFLHDGKVAWAYISDEPGAILDLLQGEAELRPDDVREVVDECRRTGARLTDTLVAFGLVDRASLRVSLLRWTRRQLAVIANLEQPETLFLPKKRRYSEELLFELDEVLPAAAPARRSEWPPFEPPADGLAFSFESTTREPAYAGLVERCLQGEGVLGAAVIHGRTGLCLASRGQGLTLDIAWAQVHSLNIVARQEQVEDAVIVSRERFHLLRLLQPGGDVFVYVVVKAMDVLLAMARVAVQRAIESSRAELSSAGDSGSWSEPKPP